MVYVSVSNIMLYCCAPVCCIVMKAFMTVVNDNRELSILVLREYIVYTLIYIYLRVTATL